MDAAYKKSLESYIKEQKLYVEENDLVINHCEALTKIHQKRIHLAKEQNEAMSKLIINSQKILNDGR